MSYYTHLLREGDVIVTYHKKNLVSQAIGYFTTKYGKISKYKACHVHLYLFEELIVEASSNGVDIRTLKGYGPTGFNLFICRYNNMNPELLEKLTKAAMLHAGEDYSYFQLFVMMFKYVFKMKKTKDVSKKAMMCSECIAQLFIDAGEPLFDIPPHEVAPAHFIESEKFTVRKIF